MASETSKRILRYALASIFLAAGLYRLFVPEAAIFEFAQLRLPLFLRWPAMGFEILAGLALLFGRFIKPVLALLAGFVIFALIWGVVISGRSLLAGAGELFVYNTTPTDWFLHLIFLGLMALVWSDNRKR